MPGTEQGHRTYTDRCTLRCAFVSKYPSSTLNNLYQTTHSTPRITPSFAFYSPTCQALISPLTLPFDPDRIR